jgi:hypothetical protein
MDRRRIRPVVVLRLAPVHIAGQVSHNTTRHDTVLSVRVSLTKLPSSDSALCGKGVASLSWGREGFRLYLTAPSLDRRDEKAFLEPETVTDDHHQAVSPVSFEQINFVKAAHFVELQVRSRSTHAAHRTRLRDEVLGESSPYMTYLGSRPAKRSGWSCGAKRSYSYIAPTS